MAAVTRRGETVLVNAASRAARPGSLRVPRLARRAHRGHRLEHAADRGRPRARRRHLADRPRPHRGRQLHRLRRGDRGRRHDRGVRPDDLVSILPGVRAAGHPCRGRGIEHSGPAGQELAVRKDLGAMIPKIEDGPWPAFPADLTSIALIVATQASGEILIFEKMFESRLFCVDKLINMGARVILCDPHRAVVVGPSQLYGQRMDSPDVRAGWAMLIAALCAEGRSRDREHPLDRPRIRARGRAAQVAGRADREGGGVNTQLMARLTVDGAGDATVATGLPALDHLLGVLARYARFDLALEVAPGSPQAQIDAAGQALGDALFPALREDGRSGPRVWRPSGRGGARLGRARRLRPAARGLQRRPSGVHVGGLGTDVVAASSTSWRRARASSSTCGWPRRGRAACPRVDLQGAGRGAPPGEACRP